MGEAERGEAAPRVRVSFWCANMHETRPSFASDAAVPELWDCPPVVASQPARTRRPRLPRRRTSRTRRTWLT
ncbi:RNA polymerase-binding protein RbpA [Nonomuraea salmonea]|uniref:RNA polymerase-binding protein RbpA n=1 Tax=Nonomuraea salmonea TaxID=46181 RepID=UPI003CD07C23